MSLIPLIPFVLAIIIVVLVLFFNILDDKFYQAPFIFALINAMGFLVYLPFYNKMIDQTWFYHLFFSQILLNLFALAVIFIVYFKKVSFFKIHYKIFLKSIKATKWNAYYVVDQKGRIKQMSEPILEELGFSFNEVKDKQIFEVFNKSIRITNFDDVQTNNRSLETFYQQYQKTVKKDQLDSRSLIFQNYQGKSVLLQTVEQPIFIMGKYKGRINIGEKRSDFSLVAIERELLAAKEELESLRLKYIATLDLADVGLYYIDLDERYLWGSEKFVEQTGLASNVINFEDYQKYIYQDDLNSYLGTLSSLTVRKQTFKTRYRLLINGQYVWVDDRGKRIFEDKASNIILGSLNVVETSTYSKTGSDIVDSLKTEKELYYHLSELLKANKTFQIALFELANIPEVNKTYGRDIGNMLISEYVKKLKTSFMSESSEIFRISGLVFAVSLVDPRKMELLRTGVKNNPKFLNLEINYGAISTEVEVFLGVSSSHSEGKEVEILFERAQQALALARHQDFKSNVCYYSDING